jgi:iron uptake system component EfeO
MAIQFRRSALQAGVAALIASAFAAQAADIPQVKVTVNDKQCEPMTITVNSGKTQFIIQNHSQKALEWEILKGVMVVEERENIAPGFSQKMTANLQPGEYDMTCGLLTNPKGKLIVKGEATADAAKGAALLSLGDAITAYKTWVATETAGLVTSTKAFTDAVKAGISKKRNPCMRQPVNTTSASSRLPNCSLTSMAALMPVKMITSRKPPIRNSPVSTVWKKPCLVTTPPKAWRNMPIS